MNLKGSHWISHDRAFTLPELFCSLAAAALLAFAAGPALGSNRINSDLTLCLSNMRHLQNAWQIYADDNAGRFIGNYHGGEAQGGAGTADASRAFWATGWLNWTVTPDNTNTLFLRSAKYSKLARYLDTERNVHKCPADKYRSPPQVHKGWTQRVRTTVLNGTIGSGNAVTGPWDPIYTQVASLAELSKTRIPPSALSTFLEENPDSINDPFIYPPHNTGWIDVPGSLHSGAGGVAFMDGHAEMHLWLKSVRTVPVKFNFSAPVVRPGDPDIAWMQTHSALRAPQYE